MCITDRKTYLHPDGSRSTVESTRRCRNAVGARLCDAAQVRETQSARLVERVPRASPRDDSTGEFETEGFNGRKIVYRPVTGVTTGSTSKRSSLRPTTSGSSPSSLGSQYSPGASYVEVRPSPPTPSSAASSSHKRVSFKYGSTPAVGQTSTASHGSPSSPDLPRVHHEERHPYLSPSAESISSTSATVNDPISSQPGGGHRSSMQDGYTSSRGSPSGPALSELPKVAIRRPRLDSAKSFTAAEGCQRAEMSSRARQRQQREEDEQQAAIEQARLAASDQRQAVRNTLARQASRERHLQDAAAALEGRARDAQQQQAASELAQMAHERQQAQQRRRGSQQYSPNTTSPVYTRPRLDHQSYSSPLQSPISPRGPMSLPSRLPRNPPIVHNNCPPPIDPTLRPAGYNESDHPDSANEPPRSGRHYSHRQSTDRGGAQRQTQRLEGAMQGMSFDGDFVLYDDDEGDDYQEYEPQPPASGRRGDDRGRRSRHRRDDYYS
nr:hypothetical protein CFP56_10947 [Quercus suber]POF00906.1 hypothetical protein CFP56_20854 [Quercus suber]